MKGETGVQAILAGHQDTDKKCCPECDQTDQPSVPGRQQWKVGLWAYYLALTPEDIQAMKASLLTRANTCRDQRAGEKD